jgi:hypothetical protein
MSACETGKSEVSAHAPGGFRLHFKFTQKPAADEEFFRAWLR